METKVLFRKFRGDVIALFPELPGDYDPDTCLSYQHVGQHGAASVSLRTKPATCQEYASLYIELRSIGYDLRIARRMTRADRLKRIAALAFGRRN